ncbi:MAG: hypothetical protein CMH41_00360 [Micrococcales bacterium]|nr:hypothetical protein [Micrococcales bacterium]
MAVNLIQGGALFDRTTQAAPTLAATGGSRAITATADPGPAKISTIAEGGGLARFVADAAGTKCSGSDFSADCALFDQLTFKNQALFFAFHIDAGSVTKHARLQGLTSAITCRASSQPLTAQP